MSIIALGLQTLMLLTEAAAAEEDVGAPGDGSKHDRHNFGKSKVHQPIGSSTEGRGLGTHVQREDFSRVNPTDRA